MSNTKATAARRIYLMRVFESDVRGFVRCFRCGVLLDEKTMTVDRILPGVAGGKYYRSNCRPACAPCNVVVGDRGRLHQQLIAAADEESAREALAPAEGE